MLIEVALLALGVLLLAGVAVLLRWLRATSQRVYLALQLVRKIERQQVAAITRARDVDRGATADRRAAAGTLDALVAAADQQRADLQAAREDVATVSTAVRSEVGEVKVDLRRQLRLAADLRREPVAPRVVDSAGEAGVPLPPPELRMGGEHFQDDRAFLDRAARDVRLLEEHAGLHQWSRLLDWGCGAGRLAVGVRTTLGHVADYHGVDVQARLVDWASANLSDAQTRFTCVDVANSRYNPDGSRERVIPGDDRSVDVFYAYSVFSHMMADESSAYLHEIARLLAPGGRAYVTSFVEESVPDCVENPPGYGPIEWVGALHCVRYDRTTFEEMISEAGLAVDRFVYGQETDGQSVHVLRLR